MALITGWGRQTWGQGAFGLPIPAVVTGIEAESALNSVNATQGDARWVTLSPSQTGGYSQVEPVQSSGMTTLTPTQSANYNPVFEG